MTKIRSALIISGLLMSAFFLSSERASAHAVFSTWNNINPNSFFFFHVAPDVSAFTAVGYKNGVWNNTTNVQSGTVGQNYYIQALNRCSNGLRTWSPWTFANNVGVWASAPTCGSWYFFTSLSQGQCGLSH